MVVAVTLWEGSWVEQEGAVAEGVVLGALLVPYRPNVNRTLT